MNSDNFWDSGVRFALCCRFCSPLTIYIGFKTFEEWNPDPEIAVRLLSNTNGLCSLTSIIRMLLAIYMVIVDNLELYVSTPIARS